jgi:hypothetical protein
MSNYPEIDLLDAHTMSNAEIDGRHRRLLRRGITGYPLGVCALRTHHDPSVLKRYMLQVDAQMPTPEAVRLCNLATLHHYAVLRFAPGLAWELDVAARAGFTRREVLDVLVLAYLNSGPSTQGPEHDAASERLREWQDPPADTRATFPPGWDPDPGALSVGLVVSSPAKMSDGELRRLHDWYERTTGEIPAAVRLLGTYRPELLNAYRLRWENCLQALPKQVMPFVMLHPGAMRGDVASRRDAALLGRARGMTREQAAWGVSVGLTFGGGLEPMHAAHQALADVFAVWPESN